MRKYSYESILSAVGRVLDEAGARSFAVSDADDGLVVETFDEEGKSQFKLDLQLPDLIELVDGQQDHESRYADAMEFQGDTLASFLSRYELVGAGR